MFLIPADITRTALRSTAWWMPIVFIAAFGMTQVELCAQTDSQAGSPTKGSANGDVYCQLPDDGEAPSPSSGGYQLLMGAPDARGEISRIDVPSNPLRGAAKPTARKAVATSESKSARSTLSEAMNQEVESPSAKESEVRVQAMEEHSETKLGVSDLVDKKKADSQELQESPKLSELVHEEIEEESESREHERRIEQVQVPVLEISHVKKGKDEARAGLPSGSAGLTRQQLVLRDRIEACLTHYLNRPESVAKRSPWAVMHGMLPFGVEANIVAGTKQVNAIGWMSFNGKCRTQRLFIPKGDAFAMSVGPGVQGHEGQFLAMLAQSHVPSSYGIQVEQRNFRVADLVQYEMRGCKEGTELTFKLIGISHYLHSDQQWLTPDRKKWSISKLVEEELAQPIVGAACGGTHRLMGLTYAVQRRQEQGLPITGQFQRAQQFTSEFLPYALSLQNPDGSFSTDWFERRANEPDMDRKVQTTGHILEWIIYSLPEDELADPRIVKALQFLLSQLLDDHAHDWAIGPRGHSLRALALYDQKVFGRSPGRMREELVHAKQVRNNSRR